MADPIPQAAAPAGSLLIVDDEPSNIQILFAALKGQAQARFATNGAQALALARTHRPDVVLLDIVMPEMDGFAVLGALRDDPATAHALVVFVSGTADDDLMTQAMAAGADDFLVKPCPPPLLQRRVALLLELAALRRETAKAAELAPTTPALAPEHSGNQRVLVVEDGEINRVILWEMLRTQGHEVTMAVSGEEGLQLLAEHAFDTVLLDIHLPGLSGLEVVRRLRAHAATGAKTGPGWIVAVTGDAAGETVAEYLAAGFDAVVRKPVDPHALAAALRRRPMPVDGAPVNHTPPQPHLLIDHDRVGILLRTYNRARLNALFGLFERETGGYLATMRASLDGDDTANVRAVAHRLKSALGHFACTRAATIADRIAHGHTPTPAELANDVEALERLMPETCRALHGALDVSPAA